MVCVVAMLTGIRAERLGGLLPVWGKSADGISEDLENLILVGALAHGVERTNLVIVSTLAFLFLF